MFLFKSLLLSSIIIISIYSRVKITRESFNDNSYSFELQFQKENYKISEGEHNKVITFDNYFDESKPGEFILPQKEIFIAVPYNSNPQINLTITGSNNINAVPEINPAVLYDRKNNRFNYTQTDFAGKPDDKFYKVKGFLWIGNNYCLHLSLKNIFYDYEKRSTTEINQLKLELKFDKLVQFSQQLSEVNPAVINCEFASKVQQKPMYEVSDTDSWIDYSAEYLKIGTAKDGIFRLYKNDLEEFGVSTSIINPKSFKLINKGEQVPIYVEGEEDGSFDENDFIEFAGIANMGGKHREVNDENEPYNEYTGRYTDTTAYWLTWGGEDGSRVKVSGETVDLSNDTLNYYYEIVHIEKNNWFDYSMQNQVKRELPFFVGNKTWMEGNLNTGTKNVAFTASDVFPGKPVKLFTKLQDYASNISQNAHLLSLKINSDPTAYDSGYINKYQQKVLSGISNSDFLINGNNTLKVNSYPTNASINACILDWYEIEYPRYLHAVNDSLKFFFPHLNEIKKYNVKITGFNSSSYSVWKYGNQYKKYSAVKISDEIIFVDSISAADKFVIAGEAKIQKPFIYYKKKFKNLRSTDNLVQYLIITNKRFLTKAEEYSNFISASYNLSTAVIDVDDIYDEYAYGYFNPESIKDFLKSTHNYWQTPLPEYVFLIGAATYDYHHNKTIYLGEQPTFNYVPSFGASVSDNWFVTWDSTGAYIPQMKIGRLPVNHVEELAHYMEKHSSYLTHQFDEWNKTFLFFSGGNGTNQSELYILKSVNDYIINNYTAPAPLGGINHHFYKTINPQTNFGPVTPKEFQDAVNSGSVFISYLGHSGTQTWDNSIIDPSQLKNNRNRSPLITDFGCSTARFAEPDVVSFSQLFVADPAGQAIAYIGNSSLGYLSTSITVPQIFYRNILKDSVTQVSEALNKAKLELISNYGSSEVNQLFTLTNTLIGDPVISLPLPSKADLSISGSGVELSPAFPTDNLDSIDITISVFNYGLITGDSITVKVEDMFSDSIFFSLTEKIEFPLLEENVLIKLPVKNSAGEHHLKVILDPENLVEELSEENNETSISFFVSGTKIKTNLVYNYENQLDSELIIFNPVQKPSSETIEVQLSEDESFANYTSIPVEPDSFFTRVSLNQLPSNKRYWIRTKILNEDNFSSSKSLYLNEPLHYLLNDSLTFSAGISNNVNYNGGGIKLSAAEKLLTAISAGFNDGRSAVISVNSQNFIPENTLRGHHVCLFNKHNLEFAGYKIFDLLGGGTEAVNNYINFIDTLSNDYLVAIAVSDEGRVSSAPLRNKIRELGSIYIDSLAFRGSWAIIGMKGAVPGTVPEAFTNPNEGRVQIDTAFSSMMNNGEFISSVIGPSAEWQQLKMNYDLPANSEMNISVLGIKKDNNVDTLVFNTPADSIIDLSSINSSDYPNLQLLFQFAKNDTADSPLLNEVSVQYKNPAELGTNYQAVSASADSIIPGEQISFDFSVFNAGEYSANDFIVIAEIRKPGNTSIVIFDSLISALAPVESKKFKAEYFSNQADGTGNFSFRITIDAANSIGEMFEDNNIFELPFTVIADTTVTSVSDATINVLFDGKDIIDGDYIADNPDIKIDFKYPAWFPVSDSTAVEFYLNQQQLYYSDFNIDHDSATRTITFNYKPKLPGGEYSLRIFGKDVNGQIQTSPGYQKSFLVSNETQLLEVYNYPNPFADKTNFTFRLTQIPDELKIKIYSIAGRLLKEIVKVSPELNIDMNKIEWNGRDEDGDEIGNGIYLYKIILKKGNETREVVSKLARVR